MLLNWLYNWQHMHDIHQMQESAIKNKYFFGKIKVILKKKLEKEKKDRKKGTYTFHKYTSQV